MSTHKLNKILSFLAVFALFGCPAPSANQAEHSIEYEINYDLAVDSFNIRDTTVYIEELGQNCLFKSIDIKNCSGDTIKLHVGKKRILCEFHRMSICGEDNRIINNTVNPYCPGMDTIPPGALANYITPTGDGCHKAILTIYYYKGLANENPSYWKLPISYK